MNEPKNDLTRYFHTMAKRPISKWTNYFDIYDMHFDRFRGEPVTVLEIGIGGGGSLQMWKWYFGNKSKIFGVDIDPEKLFKEARIKTYQCDQSNGNDLTVLMNKLPRIDIVIDDGGHMMDQQIMTFDVVYPYISDHGIYLCEDTHTSFYSEHGGGPGRKRTFMTVMKKLIDQLSAFHSRDQVPMTDFANSTNSMHFYNSVVVIEKGIPTLPEKIAARLKEDKE
jgi:cephalosporin hydroxylase